MSPLILIALFSIAAVFIVFYLVHKAEASASKKIEIIYKKELTKLSDLYPNIFLEDSDTEFYTVGHPYVWVSSNFDEFKELIKRSCYVQPIQGPKLALEKPVYSFCYKLDANRAYIVAREGSFDFNSLMHQQQWIESQRDVSENIRKYKDS
ncbi:MAG: hypothetical protein KJP25_08410 [Gammaproteobacteria bacterium]|nr:hypothetical protein [Gammaproteobacteria bacterium]MBT8150004.1 hypothetical protein [Gammaproteobacteria bacterium]NND40140.1 hypothetical protein [Pseudomonadales bacterium]